MDCEVKLSGSTESRSTVHANDDNSSKTTQFPGSRHKVPGGIVLRISADRKSRGKKSEGTSATKVSGQYMILQPIREPNAAHHFHGGY